MRETEWQFSEDLRSKDPRKDELIDKDYLIMLN